MVSSDAPEKNFQFSGDDPSSETADFGFLKIPADQKVNLVRLHFNTVVRRYDFLNKTFALKTTSFCGQSRAIQVIDSEVTNIALDKLAAHLKKARDIDCNEFMLRFSADNHEFIVFPDGRTVVKNTIDEELAAQLYVKYVKNYIKNS